MAKGKKRMSSISASVSVSNAIRFDVTELTPCCEHFQSFNPQSALTHTDAELIHETSLAPCWRKEVSSRKLMHMKLVRYLGREGCKVLSSESRRWLGQKASIGDKTHRSGMYRSRSGNGEEVMRHGELL
eukprot:scaffold1048_cov135-Skeletonema_marinoi.AAC.13